MKKPNRQLGPETRQLPGYPTTIAGRDYLIDVAGTVHRLEQKRKGKAQVKQQKKERAKLRGHGHG